MTIPMQANNSDPATSGPKQPPRKQPKMKSVTKAKSIVPQSKQDRVVAMLRRPEGTTVVAVIKATGWQKHSVHGFFAGVVRKKLGLNLVSEKKDDTRVYRVANVTRTKANPSSRKRAA